MSANEIEGLIKLPFEVQLVLVSGYLAYRIATTGLDGNHKPADTIFQVLAYGLVAYIVYILMWDFPVWASITASILASVSTAGIWRKFGLNIAVKALRKAKVTRENFYPSTWAHIIHENEEWAYISVTRDDDVVFESHLEIIPEGLPLGPLDVDVDGNIAIYVTNMISPKGTETDFSAEGVPDADGRAHLTYIPASRVKSVTVSLDTDVSPLGAVSASASSPDLPVS